MSRSKLRRLASVFGLWCSVGLVATSAHAQKPEVVAPAPVTVEPGEVVSLLGQSGCGKTTLLRLIAGFERPDSGQISVAGKMMASARIFVAAEKRRVGYVPQEGALFPHLSVYENVAFGLAKGAGRSRTVERMLELTGIAELRGRARRGPCVRIGRRLPAQRADRRLCERHALPGVGARGRGIVAALHAAERGGAHGRRRSGIVAAAAGRQAGGDERGECGERRGGEPVRSHGFVSIERMISFGYSRNRTAGRH